MSGNWKGVLDAGLGSWEQSLWGQAMNPIMDAGPSDNGRLMNIAQQIQNCSAFSQVGNNMAHQIAAGKISVSNTVDPKGVGQTNGYFSPTTIITTDALGDPSSVIHEWVHQTQARANPFFIFLKGANQIESLFTHDRQGFLDYSAQAVADKIVSVCGIK